MIVLYRRYYITISMNYFYFRKSHALLVSDRRKAILFMITDLKVGGAEEVLLNLVNNMNLERFKPIVFSLGSVNDPTCQIYSC